jgi:hypothetical protein
MSYSKGFAGSSPKFASKESFHIIVTAGKRRSTVGVIGTFRPANLDIAGLRSKIFKFQDSHIKISDIVVKFQIFFKTLINQVKMHLFS